MFSVIAGNFDEVVRFYVSSRLEDEHRFRASEFLFWCYVDLMAAETDASRLDIDLSSFELWMRARGNLIPMTLAAVEMTQLARLLKDDFIDGHDMRWNQQALRKRVNDDKAILAADLLNHLSILLAIECDNLIPYEQAGRRRSSVQQRIAEYLWRSTKAMLWELDFGDGARRARNGGVAPDVYAEILSMKHSTGVLSIRILEIVATSGASAGKFMGSDDDIGNRLDRWLAGAQASDYVGGVFNDWSEVSNYRGSKGQWDRVHQLRGAKNEVELDRPTIVHRYLQTADFPRSCPEQVGCDLADQLTYLLNNPWESGLAKYVKETVDRKYSEALEDLEALPRLHRWLSYVRDDRADVFSEVSSTPTLDDDPL